MTPDLLQKVERLDSALKSFSDPVRDAVNYMKRNYQSIRNLPSVARKVGANYHSLREQFRRETKITLGQFLTGTRILHAHRLLIETDMLIKEIAWEVGYKQEKLLTKAFHKHFQELPHVFRNNRRTSEVAE